MLVYGASFKATENLAGSIFLYGILTRSEVIKFSSVIEIAAKLERGFSGNFE